MSKNNWTPFQQALIDSVTENYEVTLQEEPSFVPSAEFERWAQKMMGKKNYRTPISRVARAILIAALITALMAVSAMAIPAIRDAIINFFVMEHDDHYGITFDPEQVATAPTEIVTIYRISEIPDGYSLLAEDLSPAMLTAFWMNDNGDHISYTQWPIPQDATADSWIGMHSENERQSVLMGEYLVEVIQSQDNQKLFWTNNSYVFCLEFSAELSQEEIEKIFASWKQDINE